MATSSIRVVCTNDGDRRQKLEQELADLFEKRANRFPWERVKSPEEVATLELILGHLREFLAEFGGTWVPLTVSHCHFVARRRYTQLVTHWGTGTKNERGMWVPGAQVLMVAVGKQVLQNWLCCVHEILHTQSFQSVSVFRSGPVMRRTGLSLYSPRQKRDYFRYFTEAITEELVIRFDRKYFPIIPGLSVLVTERDEFRGQVTHEAEEIASYRTYRSRCCLWRTDVQHYHYRQERGFLWETIGRICGALRECGERRDSEEVFRMFVCAAYSGRLLPLARLIERTLGRGSFRALAEETAAQDSE